MRRDTNGRAALKAETSGVLIHTATGCAEHDDPRSGNLRFALLKEWKLIPGLLDLQRLMKAGESGSGLPGALRLAIQV
jgi:hypothetical protein